MTKRAKIEHGPFVAGIRSLDDQALQAMLARQRGARPAWDTEAALFVAALQAEAERRGLVIA